MRELIARALGPQKLPVPRQVIRAVEGSLSIARSFIRYARLLLAQERAMLGFDAYEQPFGDVAHVNSAFIAFLHGSETIHGDDFCFAQKTKRSTGVLAL